MKTSAVVEELLEVYAVVRVAQVEDDAPLAPVVENEGRIGEVAVDAQRSEHVAHGIAGR